MDFIAGENILINLFEPVVPVEKFHPIFKMMLQPIYAPERNILEVWATEFFDRDGKFVKEFQTTFESCFWELYIFAVLQELSLKVDFSYSAPDFCILNKPMCIEATTAGMAAIGDDGQQLLGHELKNLSLFNASAAIRISNSLDAKVKKYRSSYSKLPQIRDKPFVIALASFDRKAAHLLSNRAIMSALYGVYFDEEEALSQEIDTGVIPQYSVAGAIKSNGANVPLGFFADASNSEISAVIYSCLATWGKIRALAKNPAFDSIYTTIHPKGGSIYPTVKETYASDYDENLLDGLHIFYNPYAAHPLPRGFLSHDRVAHYIPTTDGEVEIVAPDDFLLVRTIMTFGEF